MEENAIYITSVMFVRPMTMVTSRLLRRKLTVKTVLTF